MKPLPHTVVGLIEDLDKEYPPLCILPGQTEADANRYAGKRDLIDHLQERLQVEEAKAGDNQVLNR